MIYSHCTIQTEGPNGTLITATLPEGTTTLGKLEDNRHYVFSEVELNTKKQPVGVDLRLEVVTPELQEALKQTRFIKIKKEALRTCIDEEVGDLYDVMSDAMKLIEYNLMLTTVIAKQILSNEPIDEVKRTEYLARINSFLPMIDSEDFTLRSDFSPVDSDMFKTLTRYSKIQKLVKDKYVSELKAYDLW